MEVFLQTSDFTSTDIGEVAALHVREIGSGFMSSLGTPLLELVFTELAENSCCILIVAREAQDGKICGFVSGTFDTGALYRSFFRRRGVRAARLVFPHLWSWRVLRQVRETLLYPSKQEGEGLPQPELLDIAVRSDYAGRGLAQRLFHAFAAGLGARGAIRFKVGTGETLARAQRFYEKLGARRAAVIEVHRGERSFYYIYDIPPPPDDTIHHWYHAGPL